MNTLFKNLHWRDMIKDKTPSVEQLCQKPTTVYLGIDPTASSLHLGNLAAIMLLKHFQKAGHKVIIVLGGITGMLGDPSGKNKERILMEEENVQANLLKLSQQIQKLFADTPKKNTVQILNNYDWLKKLDLITYFREIGKHFSINTMVAKESVKKRLEVGISFTEFSYALFQAYDFYYLKKHYNVALQIGGADQWGNITAGIDLIRKKTNQTVHGLTLPLLVKQNGEKFGKTHTGSVWLDRNLTTPYQMYQYLLNITDQEAQQFIKIFCLESKEMIEEVILKHEKAPHERFLQKKLAESTIQIVHSQKAYEDVIQVNQILFPENNVKSLEMLDENIIEQLGNEIFTVKVPRTSLNEMQDLVNLLSQGTNYTIFTSKSEARKMIMNGGIKINQKKISLEESIKGIRLTQDKYLLIQKGKNNFFLIHII